jgi:hypothetical protein
MTSEEIKEKFTLYNERHYFWRDKVLTQLGYSINLFLTVAIATLAYLITQKKDFPLHPFRFEYDINYSFIFYLLSILLLFYSIVTGCISVTSRLFDLRITSHTFKIRKKTVEKLKEKLLDESPEIDNERFKSYINVILGKEIKRVKEADYSDLSIVKAKFNHNRDLTRKLGELTWNTHYQQIVTLLIAIVIYGLLILTKFN